MTTHQPQPVSDVVLAVLPTVTPAVAVADVPDLDREPGAPARVVAGHVWRLDRRSPGRATARRVTDTLLVNLALVVSLVVVAGVALAAVVTLLLGQIALALALGAVSLVAVAVAIEPAGTAARAPDEAEALQEHHEADHLEPALGRAA